MSPVPPDTSDEALIGLNRAATVARLFAGAVHDANNALLVISGTVEMLESRADTPSSLHAPLARLRGQSGRAAAALAQVLQFAKAPRDGSGPVSLRELVDESLALRDFSIRRAGLASQVEAEPGAYLVTANRSDLLQALLNVLINAEQALQNSRGTVTVQLFAADGSIALRVADDGAGVTLDSPERLFEPFVTTGDPFESPGLGLWVARTLVERHGGTLTMEHRAGGAAFVMRFPERRERGRARFSEDSSRNDA